MGVLQQFDEKCAGSKSDASQECHCEAVPALFEFENVRLKFSETPTAPSAPGHGRKVGARGLRMILEELMLELMYSLPAREGQGI